MAASTITPSRAARHRKPESKEPPPRSRLRRILRWALWLAVPALAICAGTVIGLVYAFARVPLPDEVPTAQTIVFLDQTGGHEIGTLTPQENRRVVPLDKIKLPSGFKAELYSSGHPGARTMVRVLRRLGYRFAIVSGGFSQITDRLALLEAK